MTLCTRKCVAFKHKRGKGPPTPPTFLRSILHLLLLSHSNHTISLRPLLEGWGGRREEEHYPSTTLTCFWRETWRYASTLPAVHLLPQNPCLALGWTDTGTAENQWIPVGSSETELPRQKSLQEGKPILFNFFYSKRVPTQHKLTLSQPVYPE